MTVFRLLAVIVALVLCSGCAAPTTAPIPFATLPPSPTLPSTRLPTLSPPPAADAAPALTLLVSREQGQFPPADVPACKSAASLARVPFRWSWDLGDVPYENVFANAPLENWTYYRCTESPAAVLAFYRQVMTAPNWEEHTIDARREGTLAIFDNAPATVSPSFRWVYLWFLPDPEDSNATYLVAAWWNGPHTC